LEGVYTSLELNAPASVDAGKLRARLDRELAKFTLPHLRGATEYEPRAGGAGDGSGGGVRVRVRTDGDVRTLLVVLAALQQSLGDVTQSLEQPPYTLTLDGKQRRVVALNAFDDWFRLRDELQVAVGPEPAPKP
jgi:hypothetical protein